LQAFKSGNSETPLELTIMLIKFHGPFNEKIGKSPVEFRVEGGLCLIDFSRKLVEKYPALKDYATGNKSYEILNSIFFVAREGELLKPEDVVRNEDELEIIAPVDGG
jgi:molybdopterin converting factor small subunit